MEAIFTAWVDILLISQTAAMRWRTKGWDTIFQKTWGAPFRDVRSAVAKESLNIFQASKVDVGMVYFFDRED